MIGVMDVEAEIFTLGDSVALKGRVMGSFEPDPILVVDEEIVRNLVV